LTLSQISTLLLFLVRNSWCGFYSSSWRDCASILCSERDRAFIWIDLFLLLEHEKGCFWSINVLHNIGVKIQIVTFIVILLNFWRHEVLSIWNLIYFIFQGEFSILFAFGIIHFKIVEVHGEIRMSLAIFPTFMDLRLNHWSRWLHIRINFR
jgi:hypothetical protein